ncbi:kinase-like domain-containing protein [Rhizophagus irregularis DAOM 181602=DAOM 197198]|nr:kinase-like domain-containing protein [Rhizophagus irregularis DAOM 181602=DAOM 197198]
MLNILMREDLNLNENLNEFLKEWEYHTNVLSSNDIIEFYGFTKDPNTSKYMGLGSLDESTSKKSNEISENEDSQASVKANEILVSEDLNDYIIKGLGSLDIKADEN